MRRIKIRVKGMSCQHCVRAVEQALVALDGITEVQVSLEKGLVELVCDENRCDISRIEAAIKEEGYEFAGSISE